MQLDCLGVNTCSKITLNRLKIETRFRRREVFSFTRPSLLADGGPSKQLVPSLLSPVTKVTHSIFTRLESTRAESKFLLGFA